ncbi:Kinesin-like protein [Psidium guajava]|nr:Kinesin-like protein [Psidium guajava]
MVSPKSSSASPARSPLRYFPQRFLPFFISYLPCSRKCEPRRVILIGAPIDGLARVLFSRLLIWSFESECLICVVTDLAAQGVELAARAWF